MKTYTAKKPENFVVFLVFSLTHELFLLCVMVSFRDFFFDWCFLVAHLAGKGILDKVYSFANELAKENA